MGMTRIQMLAMIKANLWNIYKGGGAPYLFVKDPTGFLCYNQLPTGESWGSLVLIKLFKIKILIPHISAWPRLILSIHYRGYFPYSQANKSFKKFSNLAFHLKNNTVLTDKKENINYVVLCITVSHLNLGKKRINPKQLFWSSWLMKPNITCIICRYLEKSDQHNILSTAVSYI